MTRAVRQLTYRALVGAKLIYLFCSAELGILLSCINDGTFGDAFNSLSAVIQQEFINLNDTSTREAGYSFDPSLK
jgi:hypothetical protein